MKYEAGVKYRVIRDGGYLAGRQLHDSSLPFKLDLPVGTIITCAGRHFIGSVPVTGWRDEYNRELARQCSFHPYVLAYAETPAEGYLAPLNDLETMVHEAIKERVI